MRLLAVVVTDELDDDFVAVLLNGYSLTFLPAQLISHLDREADTDSAAAILGQAPLGAAVIWNVTHVF